MVDKFQKNRLEDKHESLLREDRENLYSNARSFVPPFGGSARLGRTKVNDSIRRLFALCNLPSGFPHMRCYTFALPSLKKKKKKKKNAR